MHLLRIKTKITSAVYARCGVSLLFRIWNVVNKSDQPAVMHPKKWRSLARVCKFNESRGKQTKSAGASAGRETSLNFVSKKRVAAGGGSLPAHI
jgi:hypothetical protein